MRQLTFERAFPQRKTPRRRRVAPRHLQRQSLAPLLSVPAGVNPFEYGARHAEAQAERLAARCRRQRVPVETIWLDEVGHDSMRPGPGGRALDRLRSLAFPEETVDDSTTPE